MAFDAGKRFRIFVIDDETNIRKILGSCFESDGRQVTGISNVVDAVRVSNESMFDLALVDLRPGMANGLDLIPALPKGALYVSTQA